MLEALALPDYTLRSDIKSKPSEADLEESSKEDPNEENPSEEDPIEAYEPRGPPSPSLYPSPVSALPPPNVLPPRKRFRRSPSPQPDATTEVILPELSFLMQPPRLRPRQLFLDIVLDRLATIGSGCIPGIESAKQEIEAMHTRAEAAKEQVVVLYDSLGTARVRISDLKIRAGDVMILLYCDVDLFIAMVDSIISITCRDYILTKGAVGLTCWFEKKKYVFCVSNCTDNGKVKYAACTLLEGALTWWNSYAQAVRIDAAYKASRKDLVKMMTEEYCPRNELQKMENELWNLTVKGTDIFGYTKQFQVLALIFHGMVSPEEKKIECYIWGPTNDIQGNVTSLKPTKIQVAIRMAHNLIDQVEADPSLVPLAPHQKLTGISMARN
ncbi:reverse transcriptase domain-containing protein [Tanacetum coccineum]